MKKLSALNFRNVPIISSLQGIPNNLAKRSTRFVKHSFDIVISSLLLLLSPLFLALFLIIRKDGGKAVYNQVRGGRDHKAFKGNKFRTMVVNS